MRHFTVLAITVGASLVYLAGVQAQKTPNLSGNWTLIPASVTTTASHRQIDPTSKSSDVPTTTGGGQSPGRTGGSFECLESCTITQTAKTLTIRQHVAGAAPTEAAHEVVLPLDGAEAKDIRSEPGHWGGLPSTTKARWEKDTLVVSRGVGGVARLEQVISLNKGELTIVTKTWVGGTSYNGGPKAITFRYKKR